MHKRSWSNYIADPWNYLDIMGCVLFIIGWIIRLISLNDDENIYAVAKFILCIDLCIWYLRLLYFFYIYRIIGPNLSIIGHMVNIEFVKILRIQFNKLDCFLD